MTREVRRTDYADGCWCEQDYEDGELHGSWKVFYPDGSTKWERQYEHGCQQGVARSYDEAGNVTEEQWFRDGKLHGPWVRLGPDGQRTTSEFRLGYPLGSLSSAGNPDFRDHILPLLDETFDPDPSELQGLLESLSKPTVPIHAGSEVSLGEVEIRSYAGMVTAFGRGERWPEYRGQPLAPLLQLVSAEFPLRPPPWDTIEALTVFAVADGPPVELGQDIVVRTYRSLEGLARVDVPEVTPVCRPRLVRYGQPMPSYPDNNDMPPRLERLLGRDAGLSATVDYEERLLSRISGWPAWIQSTRVSHFGRFAFQLDSLDLEDWSSGDCTIHYFFSRADDEGIEWLAEMT